MIFNNSSQDNVHKLKRWSSWKDFFKYFKPLQFLYTVTFGCPKKIARVKLKKTDPNLKMISPTRWFCRVKTKQVLYNKDGERGYTLCVLFYTISMKSYAGKMDIKLKWPILGKTVSASKPDCLVAHFITNILKEYFIPWQVIAR